MRRIKRSSAVMRKNPRNVNVIFARVGGPTPNDAKRAERRQNAIRRQLQAANANYAARRNPSEKTSTPVNHPEPSRAKLNRHAEIGLRGDL